MFVGAEDETAAINLRFEFNGDLAELEFNLMWV